MTPPRHPTASWVRAVVTERTRLEPLCSVLLQRLQDGGPSAIEGLALFTARTSEGLAVYVSPRAARALEETVAYLGGRPSPPPPDTPTLRLVTGDPGVWRQVVRPV